MTVTFDADSGRLLLDQSGFDRLVAWVNGDHAPGPDLTELRQAGVIGPETPHPAVAAGLAAVTRYVCQLRLELVDDRGEEKTGDGWIDSETATLLLDARGGLREFITVPPMLLPAAIARVVRLGPHPLLDGDPLHMARDVFENLFGPGEQERRAAAARLDLHTTEPQLPALVDRLVTGPWRRWTATMAWYTPQGEPGSATLQVLDADACLCLCEVSGATATLWPTNATGVWRRLTLLLPDEVDDSNQT